MKIAITSDWHFHNHSRFATITAAGANTRLLDIVRSIEWIGEECQNRGITHMIVAGDVFHSRKAIEPSVSYAAAHAFMALKGRYKISNITVLVGNHDMSANGDGTNSVASLGGIVDVVSNSDELMWIDKAAFGFIPYMEDPMEVRHCVGKLKSRAKYLIGHLGMDGAVCGPSDIEIPGRIQLADLSVGNFSGVFLGHYHKHQLLSPNAMYVGSPLQLNMGERDELKGFVVLDIRSGNAEFVENTVSPKFTRKIVRTQEDEEEIGGYVEYKYTSGIKPSKKIIDRPNTVVNINKSDESEAPRIDFSECSEDNSLLEKWVAEKATEGLDPDKLLKEGQRVMRLAEEMNNAGL